MKLRAFFIVVINHTVALVIVICYLFIFIRNEIKDIEMTKHIFCKSSHLKYLQQPRMMRVIRCSLLRPGNLQQIRCWLIFFENKVLFSIRKNQPSLIEVTRSSLYQPGNLIFRIRHLIPGYHQVAILQSGNQIPQTHFHETRCHQKPFVTIRKSATHDQVVVL